MPIFKVLDSGIATEVKIPLIGLGTGKIVDSKEIDKTISSAIQLGYRLFDTAYGYKNEIGIGQALEKHLESGIVTRDELFIITKLPLIGMKAERVSQFVNLSLQNLKLDYLDLYLIHWPIGLTFVSEDELMPRDSNGDLLLDMDTNLEDIWKALEDQVEKGKLKAIGLSNFNQNQIQRILNVCKIRPANLQVEVHAYFQQSQLREFCMKNNISVCAHAPLGSQGRSNYINAHKLRIPKLFSDPVVKKIAAFHEKTPAQILLRFLIQALKVSVIPKTVNDSRLKENIEIFDFELTSEEVEKLMELDEGELGRSCQPFDGATQHPECPFKASVQ